MQYIGVFVLMALASCVFGQEAVKPRPSPLAITSALYKDTYLKITYSQPHKRGRDVFGKLVPFGEVWQTGDNEATEMTITRNIIIGTDTLRAGTYSVFTIPGEANWTIIFNASVGQWGIYNYNEKKDVLRFEAPVEQLSGIVFEPFTIDIFPRNDQADISLIWDQTKVSFTVQFLEPEPR